MREAWATLPESSSRPLPAALAQSRNLAHASLETAVHLLCGVKVVPLAQDVAQVEPELCCGGKCPAKESEGQFIYDVLIIFGVIYRANS